MKTLIRTIALLSAFVGVAHADLEVSRSAPDTVSSRDFGLGLIVGDPTAISLKGHLTGQDAFQLHVGWRLGEPEGGRVTFIADYLRHFVVVDPAPSSGQFAPYVGIGGKLGVGDGDMVFGPRVPLGLSYYFGGAPVELALEIAPGVAVLPETSFMVDGGFAARFYF